MHQTQHFSSFGSRPAVPCPTSSHNTYTTKGFSILLYLPHKIIDHFILFEIVLFSALHNTHFTHAIKYWNINTFSWLSELVTFTLYQNASLTLPWLKCRPWTRFVFLERILSCKYALEFHDSIETVFNMLYHTFDSIIFKHGCFGYVWS